MILDKVGIETSWLQFPSVIKLGARVFMQFEKIFFIRFDLLHHKRR